MSLKPPACREDLRVAACRPQASSPLPMPTGRFVLPSGGHGQCYMEWLGVAFFLTYFCYEYT